MDKWPGGMQRGSGRVRGSKKRWRVFWEIAIVISDFGGHAPREVSGELSPASVYVGLLPVVEAFVVVAVPWRVGSGFPPTSRRPSILTGLGSG